jgi:hypothetical protein
MTVPIKKNTGSQYVYVMLFSGADTVTTPTIAAGDFKLSIDDGAEANPGTLPAETPASSGWVKCALSADETNGDVLKLRWHDAAGDEWDDGGITIRTSTVTLEDVPTADEAADAVWDEVLTSAAHDVNYSAGQRLRYMILTGAAATAGSANSITLAATESATDNIFNENIISIVSGTGAGQTRLIAEYNGTTKVATVDKAWNISPAAGSVYEILPFSSILLSDHGIATGGAAGTITLATTASATDDIYIGSVIYISSGTGAGQIRLITDYNGTTKVAAVSDNWTTNPAAGSVYKILPVGRSIVDSMSDDANAAVWAYGTRTLTQTAATIAAAISGGTITIHRGDSLSASITGMGDISGRSKLWFTVKAEHDDTDAQSIIQIEETAGLVYLNAADASARAANGSITVTDEDAGDITIALDETETDDLVPIRRLYYDVQMLTAAGAVTTLANDLAVVTGDITRVVA